MHARVHIARSFVRSRRAELQPWVTSKRQRNRSKGGYAVVRLKVMFAVVMGLLAAVLVPVSSQIRSSMPGLSGAQLTAASVARTAVSTAHMRPTPTPAPPADTCALIVPEDPLSARG